MLGSCILGSQMFARGKGVDHWSQARKFTKQHVEMWHPINSGEKRHGATRLIAQDSTSATF